MAGVTCRSRLYIQKYGTVYDSVTSAARTVQCEWLYMLPEVTTAGVNVELR